MERIAFTPSSGTGLQAKEWSHRRYICNLNINQSFALELAERVNSSRVAISFHKKRGMLTFIGVAIISGYPQDFEQVELAMVVLEDEIRHAQINAALLEMVDKEAAAADAEELEG